MQQPTVGRSTIARALGLVLALVLVAAFPPLATVQARAEQAPPAGAAVAESASPAPSANGQTASARFLPLSGLEPWIALIGPPPGPESIERSEDLAIVLWLQETRTRSQVSFTRRPVDLSAFLPAIGEGILDVDAAALGHMFEILHGEAASVYGALKAHFGVPRPFATYPTVQPVAQPDSVQSYPSGHATRGMLFARVLAEIFPDREERLLALGRQMGYARVLGGVHYPSDVVAGQKLGNALADAVIASPAFAAALQEIGR